MPKVCARTCGDILWKTRKMLTLKILLLEKNVKQCFYKEAECRNIAAFDFFITE